MVFWRDIIAILYAREIIIGKIKGVILTMIMSNILSFPSGFFCESCFVD